MIVKNKAQLKDWIKNLSKKVNIVENILLQNYMLERLLERISVSKYNEQFILKGGMLISAIVGIDMRATMDMDVTIKRLPLKLDKLENILNEIIEINIDDEVNFKIINIKEIRKEDEYGGYKVTLEANFDGIRVPIKIDITTGDVIIPKEINYTFKLLFEDRSINILAYNIETIMSEKLEAIITRGIDNTRLRDFYDIYTLFKLYNIDTKLLKIAVKEKFKSRGTINNFNNIENIFNEIKYSEKLKELWYIYCKNYSYAEGISYDKIIDNLRYLINTIK
ncbi:MAG: nucleotidyl transferase AbiEii/AbiGii toxin family protein [Clostridia bacterium]